MTLFSCFGLPPHRMIAALWHRLVGLGFRLNKMVCV